MDSATLKQFGTAAKHFLDVGCLGTPFTDYRW
jgi:hypothetical protein